MKKNFLEKIKTERLYFDGATGSVLQSRGLPVGTPPEKWTLTNPDEILRLHKEYLAAGANIIKTNDTITMDICVDVIYNVVSPILNSWKCDIIKLPALFCSSPTFSPSFSRKFSF
jgi:hypothetical protein